MRTRWLFRFWLVLLVAALPALVGCKGDDGDDGDPGPQGIQGDPGPQGEPGTDATPTDLIPLGGLTADEVIASNLVLDLTQTVSYDSTTGAVMVHFFLTDEDGNGVDVTKDAYELRVYVAELIPADEKADPTDNPGPAWNRLLYERGTPAAGSPMGDAEGDNGEGTLELVDADTGEYNYTLAGTLEPTDHVIRVTMRARWRTSERDKNGDRIVFANPVNAHYDFLQADPGTRLASSGADMVSTAACDSCHGDRIGDVGHGGGYTQVTSCNNCHNVNYMATREPEADFAHMIHTIHAGGTIADLGAWDDVEFPQALYNCGKCHDGPDAAQTYENPSRFNCGPCHSNVNFATGENHDGGVQTTDSACNLCHPASAIQGYHDPATNTDLVDAVNVPEFDVTISMTDPANGEYYQEGEMPIVTVTLKNHSDGSDVDPAIYTNPAGAEGDTSDAAISAASLRIYGPRDEAVPVLATCSTTDPDFQAHDGTCGDAPTQGHNLFVAEIAGDGIGNDDGICDAGEACTGANGDGQVISDATGFKYQLLPIPASLASSGTFMVRFEGADYGGITSDDYVTSSSKVINFQIGTAEEELKVSGDACTDCHGDSIMHLTGSHAHHAQFNTDECLACHDRSGNYGDYIGNRVHAVHRASVTGDTHNRDWFEIAFPRPANNCTTCHTNELETPVWREPYMLACGGCHGVMADADPEDPSYYQEETDELAALDPMSDTYETQKAEIEDEIAEKEAQIRTEVAAAQHMEENGGDAVADAAGEPHTLQCMTCHGPGRVADLYNTHHLVQFRELPEDPNE